MTRADLLAAAGIAVAVAALAATGAVAWAVHGITEGIRRWAR